MVTWTTYTTVMVMIMELSPYIRIVTLIWYNDLDKDCGLDMVL